MQAMPKSMTVCSARTHVGTGLFTTDSGRCVLSPDHNLILFFSLPFLPRSKVYKKNYFVYGHLSLALGSTVYQLHDPARLRSSFLVSRMPVDVWLFDDGPWFEQDKTSPAYRHIHLYETAEVKRTAVFFAALKNFPLDRQKQYARYFELLERSFQQGRFMFRLVRNNCTHALNAIFYREQWMRRGMFDFIPSIVFKKIIAGWERRRLHYTTGCFYQINSWQFKVHPFCLGIFSLNPAQALIRRLGMADNVLCRTLTAAGGGGA